MTGWAIFWFAWIITGFVAEMIAVFDNVPNNTLSATLVTYFPPAVLVLGAVWLVVHFATRHKGKMRVEKP